MSKRTALATLAKCTIIAVVICWLIVEVTRQPPRPAANAPSPLDIPDPNPGLSPSDVVRFQLQALKHNDASDTGIAQVFKFSSPDNRHQTGPLPRFIRMVKNPPFDIMLGHRASFQHEVEIVDGRARQLVELIDRNGNMAAYMFDLRKQESGPYKGCWMTEGVLRLPLKERFRKPDGGGTMGDV